MPHLSCPKGFQVYSVGFYLHVNLQGRNKWRGGGGQPTGELICTGRKLSRQDISKNKKQISNNFAR